MIQPIDSNFLKPVYNAVDIKIRRPEVNAYGNKESDSITTDNGVYNAVTIDIDRPAVNTEPKIYNYPEAESFVTYSEFCPYCLPVQEPVRKIDTIQPAEDIAIEVPEPNYTTLENEKGIEGIEEKSADTADEKKNNVTFHGTEPKEVKKPEIIPGEDIKPDVDIPLVVSNLTDADFDKQALQMEEIARVTMDNSQNAIPYIVREVFTPLIEISKKDTKGLAAPTEQQITARKKLIADFIAIERNPQTQKVPYELTEKDIALANKISPLEQAERNKEYAVYTMAVLAKVYIEEVQDKTGNVVPMTDVPGMSAIVDALKYNPNSSVKAAAIDSLRYIQRPEYKEELTTLYSLAQADNNPQVSLTAARALIEIQNL